MPLWYGRKNHKTFNNMDLISEFLDIWLQTRKNPDIDPGELAGVIDTIYDYQPSPGKWILIDVKPAELKQYITTYVGPDGKERKMIRQKDVKLSSAYIDLIQKGHLPTPIFIAGVEDPDDGTEGIVLLDGRHRIHSAVEAGLQTIEAYLPHGHLPCMDAAKLLRLS